MLENKKVIIFDLDGTLLDTVGIWNSIDEALIKTIGDGTIDDFDIAKQRDQKLKEYSNSEDMYLEYCGFLKEKYNSEMTKYEIKRLRYEIAEKYLKKVVDYKKCAEKVLKLLKEKNFLLGIASTTDAHTIEFYKNENKNIIEKADFKEVFDVIYSRADVTKTKPNPEVYNKILEVLKVTPEECLIFEDALIGVQAGKLAGVEVAVIYDKYSDGNREEINKLSDYQFKNWNEVYETILTEV